jgi:murein DD-endopeptidase MepM/ murein hydrolase activator NlpD
MRPSPQQLGHLARVAGGNIERLAFIGSRNLGRRTLVVFLNLLVAAIVVSLPFIASSTAQRPQAQIASVAIGSTSLAPVDGDAQVARVATQARGGTITAGRNPMTVQTQEVRPIPEYTLSASDTLWTIANYYGVSAEAIAFANRITDPYHLQSGRQIMIPPLEGALYTVAEGDTVASVASRFKVDTAVIVDYNRLAVEPEHFAPGQLIFVESAALPALAEPVDEPSAQAASVIARVAPATPAMKANGYLTWPTNGVITQNFWGGHTGVDLAAPYGTPLTSSVNGVISENGWVAVGGLHVCVHSGNLDECYFHLSAAYPAVGTAVTAGQVIAAIGLSGVTTGPHVHWETKIDGKFVNPLGVQP